MPRFGNTAICGVPTGSADSATQHVEQLNMVLKYSHLVEVDESSHRLVIHRIYPDGRRELFTEVDLPTAGAGSQQDALASFCRMLGENLLVDSPVARKLLRL
jgi:hypothetical protein